VSHLDQLAGDVEGCFASSRADGWEFIIDDQYSHNNLL